MANIVILSPGGWGTALAVMTEHAGHEVTLWGPFQEELDAIRRFGEHRKLLPGVPVSSRIALTTDLSVVRDADLILMTVPSFAIADTASKMKPYLKDGALIANAGKGIDHNSLELFTTVIGNALPGARVAALSGPSHAEEVARAVPTSIVSACRDEEAAAEVQNILMNDRFRVYVNDDVTGVELGGAMKNIIALAAGICDGLGIGDNTKAALMTRGLAEIARLGAAMGARVETFAGLSGMGDLIVTCGSMHSRNRRAGILIGKGVDPQDAIKEVGTVEGYLAAESANRLAKKYSVDMPITAATCAVCYDGASPTEVIHNLMTRRKRHESEERWAF